MAHVPQACQEGIIEEARVVFHRRGPITYAKYTSTIDGNPCSLVFDGVATLFKGDLIRLHFPPRIAAEAIAQLFPETFEWGEIRGYLLSKYEFDVAAAALPETYPPEVGFFYGLKAVRTVKALEIEDVTRAITYAH